MKRLLLTGANGNIGAPLLKKIRNAYPDLAIRVADLVAPPADSGVEFVRIDFRETGIDYDALMRDVEIVYHLGAETLGHQTHHTEVNVVATRELALAAERSGSVAYFLYTSTSLAHGYRSSRHMPDGQPIPALPYIPMTEPMRGYALSKYYSEKEIEKLAQRVQFVILRPVNVLPRREIEQIVERCSPGTRLWWSHRIWHPIDAEDAATALSGFLEPSIWSQLGRISYFNFSADSFGHRAMHAMGTPVPAAVRPLLMRILPLIDNAKDMIKYRYTKPVWNYTASMYDNSGLQRLGLAPNKFFYTRGN